MVSKSSSTKPNSLAGSTVKVCANSKIALLAIADEADETGVCAAKAPAHPATQCGVTEKAFHQANRALAIDGLKRTRSGPLAQRCIARCTRGFLPLVDEAWKSTRSI